MIKFYLDEAVQVRFHVMFNEEKFFLFTVFENIEEKILVGDLNNKLTYSYMLICSLSHELYTPINHLLNSSDILLDYCHKLDAQSSVGIREEVNLLQSTSQCLLIFVQNMLDFARYINKSLGMKACEFKLKEAVQSTVDLFKIKAKRKKLSLEVQCPDFIVKSDKTKVQGLLFIFLDNAIKYTHKGGIKVKVSRGRSQEHIRFEILDTGIGIDELDLNKLANIIENPFCDMRTTGAAGIGIGFRVSQVLMMYLSGGDVSFDVQSSRGQGTTISFDILKEAKPLDSEMIQTLQKTVTRSFPNLDEKSQFEIDRVLMTLAKGLKKSLGKSSITNSPFTGCPRNVRIRDSVPHLTSEKSTEQHNLPLTHRSPMLLNRVNTSRKRKLMTATIVVKACSPKAGDKISSRKSILPDDYTGFDKYKKLSKSHSSDHELDHMNKTLENKKVALVVDDDVFNAEFLQAHLESFGLEVYIAYDGELAIDLCMKFLTWNKRIDIIFMDYNMSTMNGDVCTRRLKSSRFDAIMDGTVIIGLTAHHDDRVKKDCLDAGMDLVEYKPFSKRQVKEILEKFSLLDSGSIDVDYVEVEEVSLSRISE